VSFGMFLAKVIVNVVVPLVKPIVLLIMVALPTVILRRCRCCKSQRR